MIIICSSKERWLGNETKIVSGNKEKDDNQGGGMKCHNLQGLRTLPSNDEAKEVRPSHQTTPSM